MSKKEDVFRKLRFNKKGAEGVKRAFLNHLSRSIAVKTQSEETADKSIVIPEQLSFGFINESTTPSSRKKIAS